MRLMYLPMLLIGSAALAWAASPLAQDGGQPASTTLPGHAYPRIDANLRATFRIAAPGAQQVVLNLSGRHEMTRDDSGAWTTTRPLTPGFHYYSFIVDGVTVADPASESYFGMGRMVSGIEVPSSGDGFYAGRAVPHGEIRIRSYMARSTGEQRKVVVYTPPDYDRDTAVRYPVLYLQHGYGEDRLAWWRQGRMNFIMDNLLAEERAMPMIVVMEDGGIATGLGGNRGGPPGTNRMAFAQAFESVMMNDLAPMIDATYRTIPDRNHRAIAGTSMGGWQALRIGLNHLDAFAYIGGFSPGLPAEISRITSNPADFNQKVKVLFLGTGTVERDSNPNIRDLHESLEKAGVTHVYYESPATAHEWLTWRRDLYQFVPLLFQD